MKSMFQPNPQRGGMIGAYTLQVSANENLQWWGQRRAGEGRGRGRGEGRIGVGGAAKGRGLGAEEGRLSRC